MIARDAESTIGAALDSVRSIADEIIVVDTGSVDRTCEIAQRRNEADRTPLGRRFFRSPEFRAHANQR